MAATKYQPVWHREQNEIPLELALSLFQTIWACSKHLRARRPLFCCQGSFWTRKFLGLRVLFAVLFMALCNQTTAANPSSYYHEVGIPVEDSTWAASSNLGAGFLTYGPYTTEFQDGAFKANFKLSVDDNSADDLVVALVDVYDDETSAELARREIHRKEFQAPRSFQGFDLSFVTEEPNNLEFRVYVYGAAYVSHRSTEVIRQSSLNSEYKVVSDHGISRELKPGNYIAIFKLPVRGSYSGGSTANLEVYNCATTKVLARMRVRTRHQASTRTQTVEVPFSYDGIGDLQTRAFVGGRSYLENAFIIVSSGLRRSYEGSNPALSHKIGMPLGSAWTSASATQRGLLTFGPGTLDVPPGVATATFNLSTSDVRQGTENVARIDVYDHYASKVIAERLIKQGDFASRSQAQDFDVVFEISVPTSLDFRVFTMGAAKLQHNSTIVRPDRLSLSALWNQRAHFEFRQRNYFLHAGVHDSDTASLVALDGIWYAFNRAEVSEIPQSQAAECKAVHRVPMQVVVRASADRGGTWSDPVVVAGPGSTANSADGCEVVDGGAFFDSDTDTWHYLGQCIGAGGGWDMCHYSRLGSSPMGLFKVDSANPVVKGGALWSHICKGRNKACVEGMTDEGTPQIITKTGVYFYVTFHGALYGDHVTGARGIARTTDFRHWQVSGSDLPNDAILSSKDCNHWHVTWAEGGCVGIGAARMLRSAGQFYELAEAADLNLLCQKDQLWVFGLLRSATIGASGTWQNYAENPIIENQNASPVGCALQYMNLFRDRGEIFLEFSLYTPDYAFPNYTYQLVDGPGATALEVK